MNRVIAKVYAISITHEGHPLTVDQKCRIADVVPELIAEIERLQGRPVPLSDWQEMEAELAAVRADCAQAMGENERFRKALEEISRTPVMPFPDRGAHSEQAFSDSVFRAWSRINQRARAALHSSPAGKEK